MTSELRVDNLKGSTTGGSINVLGEGTSATTNLQQGLCKSWVNLDGGSVDSGTDLDGVRKSFNIASVVDVDTGRANTNFTNPMADAGHISTGSAGDATQGNARNIFIDDGVANTASTIASNVENNSSSPVDAEYVGIVTHGDLA